jgi:hypothetical protein
MESFSVVSASEIRQGHAMLGGIASTVAIGWEAMAIEDSWREAGIASTPGCGPASLPARSRADQSVRMGPIDAGMRGFPDSQDE